MRKLRDIEVVICVKSQSHKWQNQTLVTGLWISVPGCLIIHQLSMIHINKKATRRHLDVITGNCRFVIESEVFVLTKEMGNFTERSEKSQTTVKPLDTGIRRD